MAQLHLYKYVLPWHVTHGGSPALLLLVRPCLELGDTGTGDTTGPEELWQLTVPEHLVPKLLPLTLDLAVLTPGLLHSATIPVFFSPSAHSHQGHTFH